MGTDPRVRRLGANYNQFEQSQDPDGLEQTLAEAIEEFNDEPELGIQKQLAVIIAFCYLAMAEMHLATALAAGDDAVTNEVAEQALAALATMPD